MDLLSSITLAFRDAEHPTPNRVEVSRWMTLARNPRSVPVN